MDGFASFGDHVAAPARNAFAVLPADQTPLPILTKGLYVGQAGDITLRTIDAAADVVLKGVAAGTILPLRALYVRQTGTSAAAIVGLA